VDATPQVLQSAFDSNAAEAQGQCLRPLGTTVMRNRRRPWARGRRRSFLDSSMVAPLIGVSLFGAGDGKETESEVPLGAGLSGPTFSTIGRDINELIEKHARLLECQPHTCLFVCECEDGDCEGQIQMTLQQYRLMREESSFFMVVAGHESWDDLVVKRESSWLIVEKSRRLEH
jgi:hypothetical protein